MNIVWTELAKRSIQDIFDYYSRKASVNIAYKLTEGIVRRTLPLMSQPELGTQEPLLITRKEGFRFLVYRNYKIIYWLNNEKSRIEISDVFDTRQNPVKILRKR